MCNIYKVTDAITLDYILEKYKSILVIVLHTNYNYIYTIEFFKQISRKYPKLLFIYINDRTLSDPFINIHFYQNILAEINGDFDLLLPDAIADLEKSIN